jgi:type II secretory pathway component PulJ
MLLALSIFSMIILMAYQVLQTTAQAKLQVSASSDQQGALRAAHRILDHAFDSRAQITGRKDSVELNLSNSDSRWLQGTQRLSFAIVDGHALWAYLDNDEAQATLLLSELDQAEFRYLEESLSYRNWDKKPLPLAVELSWVQGDEVRKWLFSTQ